MSCRHCGHGRWTLVAPDGQTYVYGDSRWELLWNALYFAYLERRYPWVGDES